MGAGVVALVTAPFVAFLLVLISGAIAYVVWAEKRDRQAEREMQEYRAGFLKAQWISEHEEQEQ